MLHLPRESESSVVVFQIGVKISQQPTAINTEDTWDNSSGGNIWTRRGKMIYIYHVISRRKNNKFWQKFCIGSV
jgi:hypothetical protein